MRDSFPKLRRQLEIVGMIRRPASHWNVGELALHFDCEDVTIKRDLHELRERGLDIHSTKAVGVELGGDPDRDWHRELLSQYLALFVADTGFDKATGSLLAAHPEQALSLVVELQQLVDRAEEADLDYEKTTGDLDRYRRIKPLLLFQSNGAWRLLADHDGVMKQFLLPKIRGVAPLGRLFPPPTPEDIQDLFRYSFRSWVGPERHRVRIRLSPLWAQRITPSLLFETTEVSTLPDGTVEFEAIVNSLEELTGWLVSRGSGVTALAPYELRQRVIVAAREALENYEEGFEVE